MKLKDRRIVAHTAVALLVLTMLLGIIGATAQGTVNAASQRVFVHYVADGPLWLHPSSPTIHSQVTDLMPTGTQFDITCFSIGDNVVGDRVWEYGTNKRTGHKGYAADKYIDTKDTQGNEPAQLKAQGIPECGKQDPPLANSMYNRTAAVAWALAHAQDPQTNGELCTKFVSEALWAGGMPQTSLWNNHGHYPSGLPFPTIFTGSRTANAAPLLLDYLRKNYSTQWLSLGHMNADNYNVPLAEIGDIIAYDWNNDGNIDHLSFIIGAADNNPQYPNVAEWGQFDKYGPADYLNNPTSSYKERGWTWSEMHHKYLYIYAPQTRAYLLHFNGGIIASDY